MAQVGPLTTDRRSAIYHSLNLRKIPLPLRAKDGTMRSEQARYAEIRYGYSGFTVAVLFAARRCVPAFIGAVLQTFATLGKMACQLHRWFVPQRLSLCHRSLQRVGAVLLHRISEREKMSGRRSRIV